MDYSNVTLGTFNTKNYRKLDVNKKTDSRPNTYVSNTVAEKKPSVANLQAYYLGNKPSFGRLRIEHIQNGAYVDDAKNVLFKFITLKDVKKVFVEIKDKGLHELQKVEEGIFKKTLSKDIVKHGDDYRFKLIKNNGEEVFCQDPYAMRCRSLTDGYSQVYDHKLFNWNDKAWMENKNPQRLSRRSAENNLLSIDRLRIYEANIPTITDEGSFEAAKAKVDEIAKDGIFNAIHIMPVESTYSYNWGYDGVFKLAPQESVMGGPDALKEFIDYAHSKNINVIMDVVPNHVGPDCNPLKGATPFIKGDNIFGQSLLLEGNDPNTKHVRDYLTNACLNWLDNYHCDGLRLDMTKYMDSDYALKQLAMEIHYHHPDAALIAEDGRNNMEKLTRALTKEEDCIGLSETTHAQAIAKADRNEIPLDNLGMDSEWDFPYHHSLYDAVKESGSISYFNDIKNHSGSRLKYPMSHDEIGNMDGTRLITKIVSDRLGMYNRVAGSNECEKGQRAAHATQAILKSKVTGEYDKMSEAQRIAFLRSNNINSDIHPSELNNIMQVALEKDKLALGTCFTTPGPKMVFQGDEEASLAYFKFFRQFSPANQAQDKINLAGKGYESGEKAYLDSKLTSINYAPEYKETMSKVKAFTRDLVQLEEEHPALQKGEPVATVVHDYSRVIGTHLKQGNDEIFTVANYKNENYAGNYGINLPKGEWKEVLNSNDAKYAGSGNLKNERTVISDGTQKVDIALPANGLLVFTRVK